MTELRLRAPRLGTTEYLQYACITGRAGIYKDGNQWVLTWATPFRGPFGNFLMGFTSWESAIEHTSQQRRKAQP